MTEKMQDATRKIVELVDKGVSIEDAYKLHKPGKELTRSAKSGMLKKAERYSLTRPNRVKAASKAIDSTLKGESIGEAKPPNHSDILRAAEMVLDRAEPKVNVNHTTKVEISLTPVDLSKYRTSQE